MKPITNPNFVYGHTLTSKNLNESWEYMSSNKKGALSDNLSYV
jgi:hypothetical protein